MREEPEPEVPVIESVRMVTDCAHHLLLCTYTILIMDRGIMGQKQAYEEQYTLPSTTRRLPGCASLFEQPTHSQGCTNTPTTHKTETIERFGER